MLKRSLIAILCAASMAAAAQAPLINFLAAGCFIDSSGASIDKGELRITPSSAFHLAGVGQASGDTLIRSITAGSMDVALHLGNPALTGSVTVAYTITVRNTRTGHVDTYDNVPLTADGSGNFNWCGFDSGPYIRAVPHVLVVGPTGPAGPAGPSGSGSGSTGPVHGFTLIDASTQEHISLTFTGRSFVTTVGGTDYGTPAASLTILNSDTGLPVVMSFTGRTLVIQ